MPIASKTITNSPQGIAVDTTNNLLYVSDTNNNRINKYTLSTGVFVGWIGRISTSPTGGDADCNGATVGNYTPGWCTGGSAQAGNGTTGFYYPIGLAIDVSNQYLYVADNINHRILKLNASNGAMLGWIGKIATSPTAGASGCAGASVDSATPGWCTGGTSRSATAGTFSLANLDGFFGNPYSIAIDATNDSFFVADMVLFRIAKYTLSTGAYVGAVGYLNPSYPALGGPTGCAGISGSTYVSWCTGGSYGYQIGSGLTAFNQPRSLAIDTANNVLYITDAYSRVIMLNSITGKGIAWTGLSGGSITSGYTGCNGTASGTMTPGWCTNGSYNSGSSSTIFLDGAAYNHFGQIFYDSSSGTMYGVDMSYHRITKMSTY